MNKTSVGTEESVEVVIWRCSVDIFFFFKIAENSQENTCPESLFNEVSGLEVYNVVKT